jgi:predicted metal-dependent hydrolase
MIHLAPVQLDLPFLCGSQEGCAAAAEAPRKALELPAALVAESAGPPIHDPPTIEFVRMRRARRYILRVRADGSVRVTIPGRGSRAEAARFLDRHGAWVQRERARVRAVCVTPHWTDGATMLLRGERVTIQVAGTGARRIARYGGRSVRIPEEVVNLRPYIEADLRALAREELGARLAALAHAHHVTVSRVSIRGQRSRWGSCSRSGTVALNFRLVQMPPAVAEYILVHELMHRKQQNHSPRFWRLVEAACPDFRDAELWLKNEAQGLL